MRPNHLGDKMIHRRLQCKDKLQSNQMLTAALIELANGMSIIRFVVSLIDQSRLTWSNHHTYIYSL